MRDWGLGALSELVWRAKLDQKRGVLDPASPSEGGQRSNPSCPGKTGWGGVPGTCVCVCGGRGQERGMREGGRAGAERVRAEHTPTSPVVWAGEGLEGLLLHDHDRSEFRSSSCRLEYVISKPCRNLGGCRKTASVDSRAN